MDLVTDCLVSYAPNLKGAVEEAYDDEILLSLQGSDDDPVDAASSLMIMTPGAAKGAAVEKSVVAPLRPPALGQRK